MREILRSSGDISPKSDQLPILEAIREATDINTKKLQWTIPGDR
jgi:hypothetical protein